MKNIDSGGHVRGESIYVDDLPELNGTLVALPFFSDSAHGKVLNLDLSQTRDIPGLIGIFTAEDIPGENQIGGILSDEPLLAEEEVHFRGQPVALIVAEDIPTARKVRSRIVMNTEALEVITDPRIAKSRGQLLFPPRTFEIGDVESGFKKCTHVFKGRADSGGQEHLYIETQGAYAIPMENGNIKIHSSTQGPTIVQKTVAKVLGMAMHQVEVDVTRLGGAFGGKEDQATAWAVLAALAVKKLNRPVKLILERQDDMYATGKRHPYSSDFTIGLDKDLKIQCFEVEYYQNGGAAADLSPAIMERTLFHVTNAYCIPHVKATAYSCKTNLVPFTAFRGFGGPQAMFVMESAIALAAERLNVDKKRIQHQNLLKNGDKFHYGQLCRSDNAVLSWTELDKIRPMDIECKAIDTFNQQNVFKKRGMAVMPICFGISFTNTSMNQARSMVHIYQDGSVSVSTGAIEMGQGVNTKLTQVAAWSLNIFPSRVRMETTNTTRVANTSPTAASSGSDLNGKATQLACKEIMATLMQTASAYLGASIQKLSIRDEWVYISDKKTNLYWNELVKIAFLERKQLSAIGHYATPEIHFDKRIEKGHPFAYHVFGTSLTVVEVDCLTGMYKIPKVELVHDFGKSMNTEIDKGQVEGALMQGIGWMTVEELKYDVEGRLLSDSLSKYKVPDIYMAPGKVEIFPLQTDGEPMAILRSKAVGEPPLMYGIGTYFALAEAIKAFNPKYRPIYDAPMTPEKVLMGLYGRQG